MFIGWLTCNLEVLLPHSLCRSTTANAPANRQMPIASVVRRHFRKKKKDMNETVKTWTDISLSDINSSRLLYENRHYRTSYFLFQQASEKANKALALLSGEFTEEELRKFSHDQLRIYKEMSLNQGIKIDRLISLFEQQPKISNHKIIEKTNLIGFHNSLKDGANFIVGLKEYDLVNISTKDLNLILKQLTRLKNTQIEIPIDFESAFKTTMLDIADWIGQFGTEKAISEKANIEKLISDEEQSNQLYDLMINRIFPLLIDLVFVNMTLYMCAMITIQHSSLTRYSKENINPDLIYTKRLPVVKKQKEFMDLLNEVTLIIKRINQEN